MFSFKWIASFAACFFSQPFLNSSVFFADEFFSLMLVSFGNHFLTSFVFLFFDEFFPFDVDFFFQE
jgi:hypothetical protein